MRRFDDRALVRSAKRVVGTAVLALVLLGGCGVQKTPDKYTGSVRTNFLRSCESQGRKDNLADAKTVCACSYNGIVKNIKFSRFKEINSELSENPGPLPQDMATIVEGCTKSEESTTTKSTTTTTGKATTTTGSG